MNNIVKVQASFLLHILIMFISMRGRINFLQLGRYGAMDEHSYRYHFSKDFDWVGFNRRFIDKQCSDEKILAFDASYLRKSGKSTYGGGYFYSGCHGQYEHGLEIGCFAAIDLKQNTANHLLANQTEYRRKKDTSELVTQYCEMLKNNASELLQVSRILAVDAWFYKAEYINTCTAEGFECITRMRDDANLRYLFNGKQKEGKGRPKKYGDKVNDCKICEFRYVCFDCRAFTVENDIYSKPRKCNYNPYEGSYI